MKSGNLEQKTDVNYTDRLQHIRSELSHVSQQLVKQHKQKQIDNAVLKKWLACSTIINMDRVCKAFQRGNLFYPIDNYHFANKKNYPTRYEALTTIKHLGPVVYRFEQSDEFFRIIIPYSYVINDSCHKPSQVLDEMLFSYTAMDCASAITVVQYLTLLDLFRIIDGDTKRFDKLFAPKDFEKHTFNQLRLGIMGNLENKQPSYNFSPLFYFQSVENNLTLRKLRKDPEKYLGSRIYIHGFFDYIKKHDQGHLQGWNGIFIGLNTRSELLFLVAAQKGENYICTYNEIKNILAYNYTIFPSIYNDQATKECTKKEVGQLHGINNTFDLAKIKTLLFDFETAKKNLKAYCDEQYQAFIQTKPWKTMIDATHPFFVSKIPVNETKDDLSMLRLFKSYRKDAPPKQVSDDMNVDYRHPAKSYFKHKY